MAQPVSVKEVSLTFAAGALGGLANSLVLWLFGAVGLNQFLGVALAPQLTPAWLYPRLVWGGIWGVLFLLPMLTTRVWSRGFIFSLGPTLVQLFVVFPMKAHKGMMGMDLGVLTPAFVVLFNAIWGWAAAIWLRWVGK